jgi:UDP-N-acetyl-2-amino-2-deoxyglucuronate dehydrogenase
MWFDTLVGMSHARNFALIGAAGFVAPRHLQAIKDTGNILVAALDPNDSVGILDRYFPDASFFTEFERFDRHAETLRRLGPEKAIEYVSICSPNYLHDAHARFALRIGAHAICEKPLVINPWNLDALEEMEKESNRRVYTVLQLRYHQAIVDLRKRIAHEPAEKVFDVDLTYITSRGEWYFHSWKGDPEKSGGVAMNIGIHFFDMLIWVFGGVRRCTLHYADERRMAGYLELERARVRWFLSLDRADLPSTQGPTHRSLTIDGKQFEFSEGFTDLHTKVYEDILAGRGYGISDARPSIQLVRDLRSAKPEPDAPKAHPLLAAVLQRRGIK